MSFLKPVITPLLSACTVLALAACSAQTESNADKPSTVERDIMSAEGAILGTLTLKDLGMGGTSVSISVSGISEGPHAMHFHEYGKCDAPDFKSAGGHYNPTNRSHGKMVADGPHAGDMMNIDVGADLKGEMQIVNERVSLYANHDLPAIFDEDGTALILHEKADDYKSQPTGAAGGRIGCAVLTR
jgi:Cu-Zn family superoxide dismutase